MADPLSATTGILALVTFSANSVGSLLATVQDFRRYPSAITQLKSELEAIQGVLRSLETAIRDNVYDFSALQLPINQCRDACEEFKAVIANCTAHSEENRRSFRDWTKLKYRGDDINAFKAMLATHKATIAIALCDANLRTANVTITALNEYKDMIQTTSCDLEFRLQEIDDKLRALVSENGQGSTQTASNMQQIQEEKESLTQCLDICAQVSRNIDLLHPTLLENITTPPNGYQVSTSVRGPETSFRIATANTLQNCNDQIQTATMWLKSHLVDLEKQLVQPSTSWSQDMTTQRLDKERLQKEVETLRTSLAFCEQAAKQENETRKNVFEDVHIADDSTQVMVSTVGDLIFARNIRAGARSTQLFGQMSDESLQKFSHGRQDVPSEES